MLKYPNGIGTDPTDTTGSLPMDEISEGLIGSSGAPSNAGQGEQLSLQGEQTVLGVFRVLILNEHSAKGGTFSSLAVRAGTGVPIRIGLCLVVLRVCLYE